MFLLNNQSLSDFLTANIYGMLKSSDGVAVYRGQVLARRIIVIEGTLIAADETAGFNRIKQIYDAYKNGAQLTAFNTTKQVRLRDVNVLNRRRGLKRVFFDVALIFEEV